MTKQLLTHAQIQQYHMDGYLIVPGFYDQEEVSKLYRIAIEDRKSVV